MGSARFSSEAGTPVPDESEHHLGGERTPTSAGVVMITSAEVTNTAEVDDRQGRLCLVAQGLLRPRAAQSTAASRTKETSFLA
ncbi:Uncharacterised protein [Mycobacteroides abscessus subsp. abscessus]|nr:Uncharacterised protein [Mycobacteroides abscessus subsp. abscessus]